VGILVDRELRESVVEVKRVNDRLMTIKLVVNGITLNVISAYTPQAGLEEEVKRSFWEGLDEMVRGVPLAEKLFIGGDFNGHIGLSADGYGEVHGGFSFGDRNEGGTSLLDFARAFELVIANSSFSKREEHLVTLWWLRLRLITSSLRDVIGGCVWIARLSQVRLSRHNVGSW